MPKKDETQSSGADPREATPRQEKALAAELPAPRRGKRAEYIVRHSGIGIPGAEDGLLREGERITREEHLKELSSDQVDRLVRIGAIEKAPRDPDELDEEDRDRAVAEALVEDRQETQREASEDHNRTPEQTEADVAAQAARGDQLIG